MKAISGLPARGVPMLSEHAGTPGKARSCKYHRPAANLGQKGGHPVDVGVNRPQHTPPQMWLGGTQQFPLLSQPPPRQQTPLHTGSLGGQHVTPSLQTSSAAQQMPRQEIGTTPDWNC